MVRLATLVLLVGCYDSHHIARTCEEPCLSTADADGSARFDGGRADGTDGGGFDGGRLDGDSVGPTRDEGRPDSGARSDAGRRDSGSDPIFDSLPDDPPPDTGLEPGTAGHTLYELCWRSRSIQCRVVMECCEDESHRVTDDPGCVEALGRACQRRYLPGNGLEHLAVDLEELERWVEEWATAAATCSTPPDSKVPFSGSLRRGERCDFAEDDPWHNGSLCEDGLFCDLSGHCADLPGRGEACDPPGELSCEDGLECSSDHECVPLAPLGTRCTRDRVCQSRWCDGTTLRCAEPSSRDVWCARS